MANPYRKSGTKFWWIAPFINGVQAHQSSKTTDYHEALRRCRTLEGQAATGELITHKVNRGSFGELLNLVEADYRTNARKSLDGLIHRLDTHIRPGLGDKQCSEVTYDVVQKYVAWRQSWDQGGYEGERWAGKLIAPASNGTINRELAIIKRAFALGQKAGKVSRVPDIELLKERGGREQ